MTKYRMKSFIKGITISYAVIVLILCFFSVKELFSNIDAAKNELESTYQSEFIFKRIEGINEYYFSPVECPDMETKVTRVHIDSRGPMSCYPLDFLGYYAFSDSFNTSIIDYVLKNNNIDGIVYMNESDFAHEVYRLQSEIIKISSEYKIDEKSALSEFVLKVNVNGNYREILFDRHDLSEIKKAISAETFTTDS